MTSEFTSGGSAVFSPGFRHNVIICSSDNLVTPRTEHIVSNDQSFAKFDMVFPSYMNN